MRHNCFIIKSQIYISSTVDKLTKKIRILANEVRNAQRNVSSLQVDNEVSMKRCKEAEIESSMKITEEEVEQRIEKIRR